MATNVMSVEELSALTRDLSLSARCLNPDCPNPCVRRSGAQGRQRNFCSDRCRLIYFRARQTLLQDWARVVATHASDDRPIPARELLAIQKWIEWHLLRYGVNDPRVERGPARS